MQGGKGGELLDEVTDVHITWLPMKNFKMIIDGEVNGQFWSDTY
jgi:hypothetical protein